MEINNTIKLVTGASTTNHSEPRRPYSCGRCVTYNRESITSTNKTYITITCDWSIYN